MRKTTATALQPPRFLASASVIVLAAVAGCRASQVRPPETPRGPLTILIAATTDVHGRLRGYDYYEGAVDPIRGLTRAATIVDSLRSANPGRVILVDAGDLLRYGAPRWSLIAFGLACVPCGLYLWHGLGPHYGLGEAKGRVDRRARR